MRLPFAPLLSLSLLFFFVLLLLLGPLAGTQGAEPLFKSADVVALVGGEDMVAASEYGYLELLLVRAHPDYHLRFRNLAWEGDTAFEQRRDLNFPTWEEQLEKIGATVVIAQFGQMESLDGNEKIPEFIAAYEKLIERFSGGGKRRVILLAPFNLSPSVAFTSEDTRQVLNTPSLKLRNAVLRHYQNAIEDLAKKEHARFIDVSDLGKHDDAPVQRDGFHLTASGHQAAANVFCFLSGTPVETAARTPKEDDRLRQVIIAKNRLWFNYWRPQNWAFLAGDRTSQPSSRDYLDPSKRWFPPEREEFLPLIAAKDKEIDALAGKVAAKP